MKTEPCSEATPPPEAPTSPVTHTAPVAAARSGAATRGRYATLLKPCLDRLIAALALLALAPLLLSLAIAIRLQDGGSVFFRQVRIGRDERPFSILKFRTMSVDERRVSSQTLDRSDGVTGLGRWLRRLKIDELPQLLNVLVGDMSLIGPRPGLVSLPEQLSEAERRRFSVRPGMTGLAQTNGNALLTWPERCRYDLHYIDTLSARRDASILLRTVLVVILGESHFAR